MAANIRLHNQSTASPSIENRLTVVTIVVSGYFGPRNLSTGLLPNQKDQNTRMMVTLFTWKTSLAVLGSLDPRLTADFSSRVGMLG
jgi:hypothetical protein